jgi:hypothetical protein
MPEYVERAQKLYEDIQNKNQSLELEDNTDNDAAIVASLCEVGGGDEDEDQGDGEVEEEDEEFVPDEKEKEKVKAEKDEEKKAKQKARDEKKKEREDKKALRPSLPPPKVMVLSLSLPPPPSLPLVIRPLTRSLCVRVWVGGWVHVCVCRNPSPLRPLIASSRLQRPQRRAVRVLRRLNVRTPARRLIDSLIRLPAQRKVTEERTG